MNSYTDLPRKEEVGVHPHVYEYTHTPVHTHLDSLTFMPTFSLKLRQALRNTPCYLDEMHKHGIIFIIDTLLKH